jgi:hypothetical protein
VGQALGASAPLLRAKLTPSAACCAQPHMLVLNCACHPQLVGLLEKTALLQGFS